MGSRSTALDPVANTDTKLLIHGLFQKAEFWHRMSSAELEYVSDRDGGFKQPLERCKLLTRWAFEYFDQTGRYATD